MSDTPEPLTAEQAAGYLGGRGHAADASQVLDQARADPGRLSWTADGCTYAGASSDGGGFWAGPGMDGQYTHQPSNEAEAG